MLACFQDEFLALDESEWKPIGGTNMMGGLGKDFGETTLNTLEPWVLRNSSNFKIAVQIFETDIPPQHLWHPYSKKFRILWEGDLAPIVATANDKY
jgi:hypothetical protein